MQLWASPIYWLLDDGVSPEERLEYIGSINKNSDLLLKLINDILELRASNPDTCHLNTRSVSCFRIGCQVYI